MLINRPTDIPGCQAWFDATTGLFSSHAGGSVVAVDGDSVGRWEDLSGNGRHLTQSVLGARPTLKINGLGNRRVVQFNGIGQNLISGYLGTSRSTYVFIVLKDEDTAYTDIGVGRYIGVGGFDTNVTNVTNGCFLGVGNGGVTNGYTVTPNSVTPFFTYGFPTDTNFFKTTNWTLYSLGRTTPDTVNQYGELYANGSLVVTQPNLSGTSIVPPVSIQQIVIGGTPQGWLNGLIAEIIVYDSPLSTEDRISVETYLKNKWLDLSLPQFVPSSISNLQLWLDASDSNTLLSLYGAPNFFQPGSEWLVTGNNNTGQLGLGDSGVGTNRTQFTSLTGVWNNLQITDNSVVGLSGVSSFVAGQDATSLFDTANSTLLTQITGNWRKILLSDNAVVALSTNGTIFVKGNNEGQTLGLGSTAPVIITTLTPLTGIWSDVFAGVRSIFALSGTNLFVCGSGSGGRFGTGNTNTLTLLTPITGNWSNVVLSELHPYHTTFLLSANTSNRWFVAGSNNFGQLGIGSTQTNVTLFTLLTGNWNNFVPGGTFNIGVSSNQRIFVTGNNSNGQLGTGNKNNLAAFTPLSGNWSRVVASNESVLALSGIRIFGTGSNISGQLGLGSTSEATLFTQITGAWNNVYLFGSSSYALSGNRLFSTGLNTFGQLGLGDTNLRTTFTHVTSVTGNIANILSDSNTTLLGRPITLVPVTSAVTTDNHLVQRWLDKSGNNHVYRSAIELPGFTGVITGPRYIANGLNGLSVLRFPGSLNSVFTSETAKTVFSGVSAYTLFCVKRLRSVVTDTTHTILHFTKNSSSSNLLTRVFYGRTHSRLYNWWNHTNTGIWTTITPEMVTNQIYDERELTPWTFYPLSGFNLDSFEVNLTTNTAKVDVNGIPERIRTDYAGLLNASTPSMSATIGALADGVNNSWFDGEIAELLIYNKVLSVPEKTRVENYLITKWGLSGNNIYPVTDGNFSNTSIWSRGRRPRATDNIYSSNKIVTIDQDVTARMITNYPLNGTFNVFDGRVINVNSGPGIVADCVSCIRCFTTGGTYMTVFGMVSGGWFASAAGIENVSTGGVSVITTGGVKGVRGPGIKNTSFGSVYVTGPVYGFGEGSTSHVNTYPTIRGIQNGRQSWELFANTYWRPAGAGIFNASSGFVDVVGDCYGGNFASGILQTPILPSTYYITGTIYGGPGGNTNDFGFFPTYGVDAINYNNNLFLTCNFVYHNPTGNSPVRARRLRLSPKPYASWTTFSTTTPLTTITYNAVDNYRIYLHPEAKDVMFGMNYGALSVSGIGVQLVGEMFIPDRTAVEYGTPVGTTLGVGIVSIPSLQKAWNAPLINIKIPNSIGRRVANTAMIEDLGNLLTKYNV